MPWRDIIKRITGDDDSQQEQEQTAPAEDQIVGKPPAGSRRADPNDPATRERRRRRLERRVKDLRYDISVAESAQTNDNRWNTRIGELDQAIEQAREDLNVVTEPPGGRTPVTLPARPVEIVSIKGEAPSDIRFTIGGVPFHYGEEIEWGERGDQPQKAKLALQRFEGDIEALIPAETPDDRREELREHLAHSVGALAVRLRDDALEGKQLPSLTLADLASPCPKCNSWRDFKGRCLDCQRREWRARELHEEVERLLDERNEQMDEAQKWREALPVLRRQLNDARQELEKYQ